MMWQLIQVPASLSSPARWTTVNSGSCCLDSCSTMGHTPQSWAKRSPYLSCICLSVWSQRQEKELRHRERMLLHWGCADNLSITSSNTCLQTTRTRCVLKASRFSRAMSVFFMLVTIARDVSDFKYPYRVMMKNSSLTLRCWLTYIKMFNMGHQWGWSGTWRRISSLPDRETESLDSFSKPTRGSLLQFYRVFCGEKKKRLFDLLLSSWTRQRLNISYRKVSAK